MTTKIYVRERQKIGSGVREPKFRIVALTGERINLRFDASHFRKTELETIAADVGAEIVYLEGVPESEHGMKKNQA